MQQDSLFRRSLVLTGTLLGLSVAWIGLVSVISVLLADRVVLSLEAGRAPTAGEVSTARKPVETSAKAESARTRVEKSTASPKPNG